MLTLGIADSHDASITLMDSGKVIFAASEERFTRRKMQQGFPFNAVKYALGLIPGRKIDKIYICTRFGRAIPRVFNNIYSNTSSQKNILSFSSKVASWVENRIARTPFVRRIDLTIGLWVVRKRLKSMGVAYGSIEAVDHHHAHILTARNSIDSDCFLAVSLDAYGDGKAGLVLSGVNGKETILKEISYRNSLGHFYGSVCAALRFNEGEEGKVMALADHGKVSVLMKVFASLFNVDRGDLRVNNVYRKNSFWRIIKGFPREDVAFALQKTIEDIAVKLISSFILKGTKPDLFLAGGFFANIKVSQRLNDSGLFNRVFVFPNMGDGGLSFLSNRISDVYLGADYSDGWIKNLLDFQNLSYTDEPEIEKKVAELLAQGKVIARFSGRMEFGPRALGNRSILYRTDDASVNEWLNAKLKRTDFMPFAPVTLWEFKEMCYKNIRTAEWAAKFMTISFACTDWMKKVSPGVVHVDGTARPQIVSKDDNAGYYKIVHEYFRITGNPSLLNTSFNMHNEPIVCSPEEALSTFRRAKLDYLAIGRFLIKANN